jgi:hypothetical protein
LYRILKDKPSVASVPILDNEAYPANSPSVPIIKPIRTRRSHSLVPVVVILSTTGTNQYPLAANPLYTGTNEMFRKGFQSWAVSKRQTGKDMTDLGHPDQHRYMVFKDKAYERKDLFLELYSDHVGFRQVSLVKTLTKVS